MRRIDDPRIRQTLNQISQNLEAANQTTQASLFTFSQTYISPCLSSLNTCLEASCQPCFAAARGEHDRRGPHHRRQARGRESLAFDFYDDWEQDEAEWGNDELDRLLSGNDHGGQPGKHGGMSYGSRGLVGRTKDRGEENDPNIFPQSSIFGFLERLPWKIGGRGRRYRPGVADLQENVGRSGAEAEPLIANEDDGEGRGRNGRSRSGTVGSKDTTNSLSSRGDLFPTEDEDDAVPLDDEFAMVLERRTTGATSDDHSSKKKGKKRLSASRTSTKSTSTKETRRPKKKRQGTFTSSGKESGLAESAEEEVPSMVDLKQEEERVRREEEAEVEERRQAAHRLARELGLSSPVETPEDVGKGAIVQVSQLLSPAEDDQPAIDSPPGDPPSPVDSRPSERPPSPKRNSDPEPPKPPDGPS